MTLAQSSVMAAVLVAAGLGGALLLQQAWRRRDAVRPWLIAGGWALVIAAIVLAGPALGPALGPAIALAIMPLAALGLIAATVQIRDARRKPPRELALEPSERASKAWRGWLRGFLAGPIGGVAALGVGLLIAVWAPGAPQTRMVIGGLMAPFLWGGAMAWTLADDKILRATAVLVGVAVVTFGASAMKGAL
ncbi:MULTISPECIES: hypothetical protein [unclassified Phenylobacterium]|uniref:hypothetical protein n=1 Tax=unclassified Phenylobacterium TaxID=2640670 RepID=UPI001E2A4793|nr:MULTISPECIES: hypothetical protein [unclassified Phenylobacterium]